MRKFLTFGAAISLAFALLTAPDMVAQTRRESTGGTTTTKQSSGTTTRQSSGTSTSSGSSRRESTSGTSTTKQSSGTTSTRQSSGTSTSSSSTRRESSSGTTTRQSSGTSSSSSSSRRESTSGTATRQSSGSTSTRQSSGSSSGSTRRESTSGTATKQASGTSSQSGTARQSSGSTARQSGSSSTKSSGTTVKQDGNSARQAGGRGVDATNVTRGGLSGSIAREAESAPKTESYRDAGYNYRYHGDIRVDDHHNIYRVPPRQRDPLAWDHPAHFWGDKPHYYGYRIHTPPPSWRRVRHWGINYYVYNGIYYRPYGGVYVICRPPFGTPLEVVIDRAIMRPLSFAYYYDTYRTYTTAFDYYNVIARQNLIIAQQNARLAAANRHYAINSSRALTAYELASRLGLIQSYAAAGSDYFYQDGVFYTVSASGVYTTIIPPAGALVTSLPDDYEIIVMDGIEYYLVDNTVYRTTVFEGEPFLEVLGQMYGSLYNQYNVYR